MAANDYDKYPPWTRTDDAAHVEKIRRDTEKGVWKLLPSEVWWRDHQRFLQSKGYLLPERFRPGWTPSWLGTNVIPSFCDDSHMNMVSRSANGS